MFYHLTTKQKIGIGNINVSKQELNIVVSSSLATMSTSFLFIFLNIFRCHEKYFIFSKKKILNYSVPKHLQESFKWVIVLQMFRVPTSIMSACFLLTKLFFFILVHFLLSGVFSVSLPYSLMLVTK